MQAAMGETISATSTGNSLLPLDTLGKTITKHIELGDKATDKAEQHYKAAGIHLAEAKERVARTKNLTWSAYLVKHCQMIGRRQADLYIEMAEGRTSLAEVREGYKQRNAKRGNGCVHTQPDGKTKAEQQQENIAAAQNQKAVPRVYANVGPDPRLKVIGKITLKARDANLSELKIVDDFFAKLLSKRKAGSFN